MGPRNGIGMSNWLRDVTKLPCNIVTNVEGDLVAYKQILPFCLTRLVVKMSGGKGLFIKVLSLIGQHVVEVRDPIG